MQLRSRRTLWHACWLAAPTDTTNDTAKNRPRPDKSRLSSDECSVVVLNVAYQLAAVRTFNPLSPTIKVRTQCFACIVFG